MIKNCNDQCNDDWRKLYTDNVATTNLLVSTPRRWVDFLDAALFNNSSLLRNDGGGTDPPSCNDASIPTAPTVSPSNKSSACRELLVLVKMLPIDSMVCLSSSSLVWRPRLLGK